MIVDKKVRSKGDLVYSDICLGASDIEMLASLPPNYFSESEVVVPFEPRLKSATGPSGEGSVVPLRRPN